METLDTVQMPVVGYRPHQENRRGTNTSVVCLVTALTVEDFLDPELTTQSQQRSPQLGVMTLAAILRGKGFKLKIVNLDDLYFSFLQQSNAGSMTRLEDKAISRFPWLKTPPILRQKSPFTSYHLSSNISNHSHATYSD